jgi:hypothetical protein
MTRLRLMTLGLLTPAALGLTATQALASGESISLVQNDAKAVVGYATNFTASGTLNPSDTMFGFDIYVFVKDADRDPTCAATFDAESANAMHSGGNESWVSPAGGFEVGYGPTFNQPFKITFSGSGNYLLCGYVNGDFSTFAAGELRGTVAGAPPVTPTPTPSPTPTPTPIPTAAAPAVVRAPSITRKRHVLTCHAGTWTNTPKRLSYGWYVKTKKVAVGHTLKVRRSLKGRKVACQVTASNDAGATTATSKALRAS